MRSSVWVKLKYCKKYTEQGLISWSLCFHEMMFFFRLLLYRIVREKRVGRDAGCKGSRPEPNLPWEGLSHLTSTLTDSLLAWCVEEFVIWKIDYWISLQIMPWEQDAGRNHGNGQIPLKGPGWQDNQEEEGWHDGGVGEQDGGTQAARRRTTWSSCMIHDHHLQNKSSCRSSQCQGNTVGGTGGEVPWQKVPDVLWANRGADLEALQDAHSVKSWTDWAFRGVAKEEEHSICKWSLTESQQVASDQKGWSSAGYCRDAARGFINWTGAKHLSTACLTPLIIRPGTSRRRLLLTASAEVSVLVWRREQH